VLVTAAAAAVMAMLASRQIGGVTGDVFGAVEQVAETAVLLMLAARLS
jgi:adenosylcobinamide-GDP ribazoletransferase